ncbi:hypothetical protein [Starkeya sp. ORNL1]|uniref:hypothetical protein n=1 Tax=Starkeya sp. ORNL1 TaxID=2709380 RepID=UPI001FED3DC1|nr:hypothetical protein [Starkeya sp. ORNL1]
MTNFIMVCSVRPLAALLAGGFLLAAVGVLPAGAQSNNGEQKPADQQAAEQQEAQRRSVEEFAEAAKLPGNAGLPECVWSGRRIAMLLWRDDIDTARRHMELYERFGCPMEHLKIAFRCLVRQGNIDAKSQEKLTGRVHACWVNPDAPPPATASAPAAAPAQ